MAAPTFKHLGLRQLQIPNTGSSAMFVFTTRSRTFTGNGSTNIYIGETTTPFDSSFPTTMASGTFQTMLRYDSGHQYDPIADTILSVKDGIVYEFSPDGQLLRSADWKSTLGTYNYQGIISGYQGEAYFYVLSNNNLYRCDRKFEGNPTIVRSFSPGTNYSATWAPAGVFNGDNIYMLVSRNSIYQVARTTVSNGAVSYISLSPTFSLGNITSLKISYYKEKLVLTFANYGDTTYPDTHIYEIGKAVNMIYLVEDGNEIKSYTDTGYTQNVCINGAIVSSMGSQPGHPNSDAFDGNYSTYWGSNETGQNANKNAFIGYDFDATPRHIRRIEILKSETVKNTPAEIIVEYSHDGAVWTQVTTPIALVANSETQVIDLPASDRARRWRIRSNANLDTGMAWHVRELRMYERNLTGWYVVGPKPATEEMFLVNGLRSTDFMTPETLSYIGSRKFKFVAYTGQGHAVSLKMQFNAVPHPRMVYPNDDIPLTSAAQINGFTLTSTENKNGIIRTILSIDEGKTWRTWDVVTDTWQTVDDKDLAAVKLNGMTTTTLNERVAQEWAMLNTNKIRFAYYIEITNIDDTAKTDLLKMNIDMHGVWEKAKDSDYTYSYPANDVVTVKLFTDGDYKINFDTNTGASRGSGGQIAILDGGTF